MKRRIELREERKKPLMRIKEAASAIAWLTVGVMLLTTCGCSLLMVPEDVHYGSEVGDVAYDFQVPSTDGGEVVLSHLRGHVVLIEFWASWCGPCRTSMPHIRALRERFHDDGLIVIAVSADSTEQAAEQYLESNGYEGFVSIWEPRDKGTRIIRTNEIDWIPRSVVVDRQGVIRYNGHAMDLEADFIAGLMAE